MNNNKYTRLIKRSALYLAFTLITAFVVFNAFDFDNTGNEKQPKHSNVRIFANTEQDVQKMMDAGLFIDHANYKPGRFMETWLSEFEMSQLRASGVAFEVLVDDWDTYFNNLPKMTASDVQKQMEQSKVEDNISHSIYGSMGGYLTFAEVVNKLDSMRIQYPSFISQKFSIGTTYENRQIWAVRVTKNPDVPSTRPQALYHALIHAREPESMETQVYYMYWLFENYGIDPIATYILNNRDIYWIPVYNPDGYEYNRSTNPNGGGMWRTNRHMTTPGCGYTDINRNYGLYEFWNSTNGGSSTNACYGGLGTYRGPLPFSELETQAMMNFVNSKNFNTGFGAHTHGNLLIKPYCWNDPLGTPDDAKFNMILADLKAFNPIYTTGFPSQTVLYKVRGGADDWYYYDSVHPGHHVFTITPETGTSFWPAQNQIVPLAQGMLENNKYMSLIAGPYVNYVSSNFNQTTYTPGSSGTFKVRFRNKGVVIANNTKIILNPGNAHVTIPTQLYNFNVAAFTADSATFSFTVAAGAPNNCYVPAFFSIKQDTSTIYTQAIYIPVGTPTVTNVLTDNANNFTNWTTNGQWGVTTTQFFSAPSSFNESPSGNYGNNLDVSMTLTNPINVLNDPVVTLSFYHKYATEINYDYCYVEVSSNNGSTWSIAATYHGTLSTWTQQVLDITKYISAPYQVKVRFRFTSDENTVYDGWFVDDVIVSTSCVGTPVGIAPSINPYIFALEQNYPNPFNPSTNIKYQLPKTELVTIRVYDIMGKEVATLVNQKKEAGYHEAIFDGTNFASGVYFYKIEAGQFVETKKMVLIK